MIGINKIRTFEKTEKHRFPAYCFCYAKRLIVIPLGLSLFLLLFSFSTAHAVIYVEPNGICSGNSPCYSSIQDAINVATDGSTIQVAQGTYQEDITIASQILNLLIQGGWSSNFSSRSDNSSLTVIDGNVSIIGYELGNYNIDVFFEGFTLKQVLVRAGEDFLQFFGTVSLTLINNTIIDHGVSALSAATLVTLTLKDNTITGTSDNGVFTLAQRGQVSLTLLNNTITDNNGPAVRVDAFHGSTQAVLINNIIAGNGGDGVWTIAVMGFAEMVLTNNIIAGNSGKGINIYTQYGDDTLTLMNNTIADNQGEGIYADTGEGGSITVNSINTIVWGNDTEGNSFDIYCDNYIDEEFPLDKGDSTINASYSDIGVVHIENGTYNDLGGNLSVDPFFVDALNGNYRLDYTSQLIDAGTNDGAPLTDFEGDIRPVDGDADGIATVDIGADEFLADQYRIDQIIIMVEDLINVGKLNKGQGNSLITKLDIVKKKLNHNQAKAACNVLSAFVNEVNALTKAKKLTNDEGKSLIEVAKNITACN